MMKIENIDEFLSEVEDRLRNVEGVLALKRLFEDERREILEAESKAEDRVIMGMCKPLNLGLRESLKKRFAFALVIDTSKFRYPHHPHMKLVYGDEVVGEQILDEVKINELKKNPRNIFLWSNFVLYYDKTPKKPEDKRKMRFLFLPREADLLNGLERVKNVVIGVPSPEVDTLIKKILGFESLKVEVGTCVVGFDVV